MAKIKANERKSLMDYAVSIATRGRTHIVKATVEAYLNQTEPPKKIVLVDNNTDPKISGFLYDNVKTLDLNIDVIETDSDKLTDAAGTNRALQYLKDDFEYIMKADDDLVPEPDFMEHMCSSMQIEDAVVAVGGYYPSLETTIVNFMKDKGVVTGDSYSQHLQFFHWYGKDMVMRSHHLYSSFLYKVKSALEIGGYPDYYTLVRHETDFSLRLNKIGVILINTKARAWHYKCEGGSRTLETEERKAIMKADVVLFEKTMKEAGIDPKY